MTKISTDAVINSIRLKEQASAPDTPASGYWQLYVKDDGKLYGKDDAGNEVCFSDVFANPMTTAGDIIYGGVDGVATRLAKGDDAQVLTLASGLPSWAAAGASGLGSLTDWTPTVTQGGSVSCTVNNAKYCVIGPLIYLMAQLTITGSGTTANDIKIGGMPANPSINGVYGSVWILDTTAPTQYSGVAIYIEANYFKFRGHLEGDDYGTDPNFALANNHAIWFFALYPGTIA